MDDLEKLEVFLVTTEHLAEGILFKDDEDFRAGMNFVPISALESKAQVLAFILMSNHVHFVLVSSRDEADAFINCFKRNYSLYYRHKYSSSRFMSGIRVVISDIPVEGESLGRAIAYVHMNCVAANICSTPEVYPWGSGNCYFNPSPNSGKPLSELSGRSIIRILHSKAELPSSYRIHESGYILPDSYVLKGFAEALFRTPLRLNWFYRNSSKARRVLERTESGLPSFKDQLILPFIPELCRCLFQKEGIDTLSDSEKAELLRQLRYRFSSDVNQLSRLTAIPYETVTKLLDSFQ